MHFETRPNARLQPGDITAVQCLAIRHIWLQMILAASLIGAGVVASVNADALILMQFGEETGTATAVMSTLKFGGGALAGPILAAFHVPMQCHSQP